MGYKFNPFTGNLDDVGSGGGGGATTPGGSTTQLQFNDAGSFGGDVDLTWNKTTNLLTVAGDVNLSDGGTYTTTLQTITPTANRTISLPDATGTVALVGGSSGQITFNSSGAYAGDSGLTYSTTNKALTVGGATVTTSNPVLDLSQTWNGATSSVLFTGIRANFTNTQSSSSSYLLDLQVGGTTGFYVGRNNNASGVGLGAVNGNGTPQNGFVTNAGLGLCGNNAVAISNGAIGLLIRSFDGIYIKNTIPLVWGDTNSVTQTLALHQDAANTLAQRNGTSAQVFRVYNTYTSGTNYELGKLEWTSNVFRIGTEKGSGGGTARTVEVHTDSIARLALDTTGSVRVVTGLTVATLPGTPAVGMVARVTDATAPAVGSTVAGGGAAAALVWYNGTNWTVIGV